MPHSNTQRRLTALLKQLGVAAIYALVAYMLGSYLKSDTVASVFEPTSGLALAVLLIGGLRYAWAIFLGELLFSVISSSPLWVTVATSLGNTLGPLLGAWLLTRDGRFDSRLRSLRDYLQLILRGGGGSGIAALVGSTALLVSGAPPAGGPFLDMIHWWMGDTLGIILITPLFLVWRLEKGDWLEMKRVHVAALLLALTFLAGQAVFLDWFHDSFGLVSKGYVMFLFIAWVAVRLGTWGTVIALVITAIQALLGAHYGTGFFADDVAATQLTNYWLYMVILSLVGMALATYFAEQRLAERQLRDLSAHLQNVREEEKAGIAREIHDDLGGTLTAMRMEIYFLERGLPAGKESAPLFERIESMSRLLDNAVGVTRRVITELRPTMLDDLGLLAAIEWQAAQFQKRTGIECRVKCIEDKGSLDKQRSIALFRIFQEALTNVARHSGASRVEVEFHHGDEEVVLSIGDNGRGMPGEHVIAPDSYGIRGMFERVGQLGGKIKFDSPPSGGLNVAVVLLLPASHKKEEKA
ncbi:MAG: MASE1 domain-containing protein [Gallionella sp.]|nr:MASE1 domain-containing protein [Gallionella sp.]